jgi:hypothetical protein
MPDAQQDTASEAARALARARWGSTAVVRSAQVVIERAAELPDATRAAVHEATGPAGGDPGDRG